MRRLFQILLLTVFALTSVSALAAEPKTTKKQRKELEETQVKYDSTMRWGTVEDALPYMDPEYAKVHPLTDLELRRYEQQRQSADSQALAQREKITGVRLHEQAVALRAEQLKTAIEQAIIGLLFGLAFQLVMTILSLLGFLVSSQIGLAGYEKPTGAVF